MFQIGDYVVNTVNGICQITDIVQLDLSGEGRLKDYYLLIPIEERTARVYVPVDTAEARIRRVLTEDEAWGVIRRTPEIHEARITNEKEREKTYKEAIFSGDLERMISIIKNMYARKMARRAQGKKSTAMDDRYFKLAESHLYAELSFATGRDRSDMPGLMHWA